jgi:hypothetical protein
MPVIQKYITYTALHVTSSRYLSSLLRFRSGGMRDIWQCPTHYVVQMTCLNSILYVSTILTAQTLLHRLTTKPSNEEKLILRK